MSSPFYLKFDNPGLETSPRDKLFDPTIRGAKLTMMTQMATFKHSGGNTLSARLSQIESLFTALCSDIMDYAKNTKIAEKNSEIYELARNLGMSHLPEPEKIVSETYKALQPVGLNELAQMVLVDFKYANSTVLSDQLCKFLQSVLKEKGGKNEGQFKLGKDLSDIVQQIVADVTKRSIKIGHPMTLKDYFKQQYILYAFIANQDDIRWCTDDCMPVDNTTIFWDQPPMFRTQDIRNKAYQQDIFRERKSIKRGMAPIEFMPPIYCKVKDRWRLCKLELNRPREISIANQFGLPMWLSDEDTGCRIRRSAGVDLIGYLNDPNEDFFSIEDQLPEKVDSIISNTRQLMYLYVVQDTTLSDYVQGSSHYGSWPPSSVQVYVNVAADGLLVKWIKSSNSHCQIASRLSSHMESLNRTYVPYKQLLGDNAPELIDTVVSLAAHRKFQHAIFVLNVINGKMNRKALERIVSTSANQHLAYDPLYGLNM